MTEEQMSWILQKLEHIEELNSGTNSILLFSLWYGRFLRYIN